MFEEKLTMELGGAFESPTHPVNFWVKNSPTFDYVAKDKNGKIFTVGSLRPNVIDWLKTAVVGEIKEVKPGFSIKKILCEKKLYTVLHYSSIHHRDER